MLERLGAAALAIFVDLALLDLEQRLARRLRRLTDDDLDGEIAPEDSLERAAQRRKLLPQLAAGEFTVEAEPQLVRVPGEQPPLGELGHARLHGEHRLD